MINLSYDNNIEKVPEMRYTTNFGTTSLLGDKTGITITHLVEEPLVT